MLLSLLRLSSRASNPSTSVPRSSRAIRYCTEAFPKKQSRSRDERATSQTGDKVKVNQEVLDYLRERDMTSIADVLPPVFLGRRKTIDTSQLYLVDDESAKRFVSMIIDDLSKNTCFVAEVNPGIGVLTKELLRAGLPFIHLYETDLQCIKVLEQLQQLYPGKLDIRNSDFFHIWKLMYQDQLDEGRRVHEAFKDVQRRDWRDATCMQVIGVGTSKKLITRLLMSVIFQTGLAMFGRPVMYLSLVPSTWISMTSSKKDGYSAYRYKTILFQLLLDYEFLGALPRKAYLPWKRRSRMRMKNAFITRFDDDFVYVVRVEPKANIFEFFEDRDDLVAFWYFIRYHLYAMSNRIIPELEKWVPGCGEMLIQLGYDIFMEFGDLTPLEVLKLYKEFKSLPDFAKSSFLSSINNFLNNMNNKLLHGLDSSVEDMEDLDDSDDDDDDDDVAEESSD